MIKIQIKSILRSKFNRLYIVIFFIIFIILNVSLNLGNVIDSFYDSKVENEEWSRTVQLTENKSLTEEQITKIKSIKHVEDYKIEKYEVPELEITYFTRHVIVDDWKNCTYVQKRLDKMGYLTFVNNETLEEYTSIRTYTNIIATIILIIVVITIIICYKSIINNEKDNMKLLSIMGYTKAKITLIKITSLLVITLIGYLASTIICGIVFIILR